MDAKSLPFIRSMGAASQATSGKKGISRKMGFELESRHLSSRLDILQNTQKRRRVACLYNEIIKMSPNTLESGSASSFCFTSDSLLGGKSHSKSSRKIYSLHSHYKELYEQFSCWKRIRCDQMSLFRLNLWQIGFNFKFAVRSGQF